MAALVDVVDDEGARPFGEGQRGRQQQPVGRAEVLDQVCPSWGDVQGREGLADATLGHAGAGQAAFGHHLSPAGQPHPPGERQQK
ncbi:hypothetical protein [Streptomyces decoyicus]|uniref:hypothetical protein n=1 Tax=Streptomyces decoyicus TaxID=249567 RepID=UPI00386B0E7E|nr:hypothetical protein OG532_01580 [Streptomyces decoyicus]